MTQARPPRWWSSMALGMTLVQRPNAILVVQSAGASVVVKRGDFSDWRVVWQRSNTTEERFGGELDFSSEELGAAFGVHDRMSPEGTVLAAELGATCAEHNKYIRVGNFLNIPNTNGKQAISLRLDQDDLTGAISAWVA